MLEHAAKALRLLCAGLAVLLLWKAVQVLVLRGNPLGHLSIPALPTLDAATNAPAKLSTNAPAASDKHDRSDKSVKSYSTISTNAPAPATNAPSGTNPAKGTNILSSTSNAPSTAARTPNPPTLPREVAMGPPGRSSRASAPPLPLPVQARVDRITESEVLGPVIRPLPMALLGIAGDTAFLRAPNGQTGLVKEGGELGGLKLLRIGTNRVLVEQDGQKKEMMMFSGFGGDSLMPKEKEHP